MRKVTAAVPKEAVIRGLERGIENLINAKPQGAPQEEVAADNINDFIAQFANIRLDAEQDEENKEPDDIQGPELIGNAEGPRNNDWEPMPLDNMDKIDRAPYRIRSSEERPNKRQCVEKTVQKIDAQAKHLENN